MRMLESFEPLAEEDVRTLRVRRQPMEKARLGLPGIASRFLS